MRSDQVAIFYFVFSIYLVGWIYMLLLFPRLFDELNLLLKLTLTWTFGNCIYMGLGLLLAFSNGLNFFTPVISALLTLGVACLISLKLYRLLQSKSFPPIPWRELAIIIGFILLLSPIWLQSLVTPMPFGDTYEVWLIKAKAYYFYHGFWGNPYYRAADLFFTNPDYPIGIPLMESMYFRLIGQVQEASLQLYFFMFYLNLFFLLAGLIRRFFKNISFLTSICITVGIYLLPILLFYSSKGYVDMALSFFIAVSVWLFIEMVQSNELAYEYGLLVLLIGLTAFHIKNEGFPFSLFLGVSTIGFLIQKKLISNFFRINIATMHVLLMVGLCIIWLAAKRYTHVVGYIDQTHFQQFQLADWGQRFVLIMSYVVDGITKAWAWNLSYVPAVLILIVTSSYLVIRRLWFQILPSLILLLQFLSYIGVYLITPLDLKWQLSSSVLRLLLQIFPAIYVVILANLKVIEEIHTKRKH